MSNESERSFAQAPIEASNATETLVPIACPFGRIPIVPQTQVIDAMKVREISFDIFQELARTSLASSEFYQRQVPNCWTIALLKAVCESEVALALLNFMCQEGSQTVRFPSQDPNFKVSIREHTPDLVITESIVVKMITQAISELYRKTLRDYYQSKGEPFDPQYEEGSIEESLQFGYYTREVLRRMFKNISHKITVVHSTDSRKEIRDTLELIQLNSFIHVSCISFKKSFKTRSKQQIINKHAYVIHSVSEDKVVIINPHDVGRQIILGRRLLQKKFEMIVSALPFRLNRYKDLFISKKSPVNALEHQSYRSVLPDQTQAWNIQPDTAVFSSYMPGICIATGPRGSVHELFYAYRSSEGIQLYDVINQQHLASQHGRSRGFYDTSMREIGTRQFECDDAHVALGFYRGHITVESDREVQLSFPYRLLIPEENYVQNFTYGIDSQALSFHVFGRDRAHELTITYNPTADQYLLTTLESSHILGSRTSGFDFSFDLESSQLFISQDNQFCNPKPTLSPGDQGFQVVYHPEGDITIVNFLSNIILYALDIKDFDPPQPQIHASPSQII